MKIQDTSTATHSNQVTGQDSQHYLILIEDVGSINQRVFSETVCCTYSRTTCMCISHLTLETRQGQAWLALGIGVL